MFNREIKVKALSVKQPIGEFFVASIDAQSLLEISFADVREIKNDLDNYLGIQRKISPDRIKELSQYVRTKDATFPSSIIIAIPEECAEWDEEKCFLTLKSTDEYDFSHIAKILDGQHRLEGLKALTLAEREVFQLNITVFIGADIADQANIFATVNLAQTKVNKSLVYDLFDYANSRSPQKSAHDIAIALDRTDRGPFEHRIKRLGTRTPGRLGETLNQATIVTCLLELISGEIMTDRDMLMRGKTLRHATNLELEKYPFRNLFIEDQDLDIARILNNYFIAIRQKWPVAWEDRSKGNVLLRTNGFRALMSFLKDLYVHICGVENIGKVIDSSTFFNYIDLIQLKDEDFNTQRYVPGTSGETALYKDLKASLTIKQTQGLFH